MSKRFTGLICMTFLLSSLITSTSNASWSWNLGYNNPPGALVGLNFMKLWTNWSIELGIGYLDIGSSSNDSDNDGITIGGDANLKYLFSSGTFRPYLQGGFGVGSSAGNSGLAIGTGSVFYGGGFFLMASSFYFYGSYNFGLGGFPQAGIGFPF